MLWTTCGAPHSFFGQRSLVARSSSNALTGRSSSGASNARFRLARVVAYQVNFATRQGMLWAVERLETGGAPGPK